MSLIPVSPLAVYDGTARTLHFKSPGFKAPAPEKLSKSSKGARKQWVDDGQALVRETETEKYSLAGSTRKQVGENRWHYEYAVHNLNSDRSGQAFEVPIPAGVEVTNVGFNNCRHHSGEPYSSADWNMEVLPGAVRWNTSTYAQTANANALRWGTMFNFRFEANAPPQEVEATLSLFKPGGVPSMAIATLGPAAPSIPGDFDGNGEVNGADLSILLSAWGTTDPQADLDGNGEVGGSDLAILLGGWG